LIVDYVRTPDFAISGSGLTRKQRSLVIIIIILLCYIALGSLVNSVLVDLAFIDALYFSTVTIESIGYGDIVVETTGAKVFVGFYVVFGIMNLALAVATMRETVLEALEINYQTRMRDMRRRRRAKRWAGRVSRRWTAAVAWRLAARGEPKWVPDANHDFDTVNSKLIRLVFPREGGAAWFGFGSRELVQVRHPRGKHLNLEALPSRELEAAAFEAGIPLQNLLPPEYAVRRKRRELCTDGTKCSLPRRVRDEAIPTVVTNRIDSSQAQVPEPPSLEAIPEDVSLTQVRLGMMSAILGRFALSVAWSDRIGLPDVGRPPMPRQQHSAESRDGLRVGLPRKKRSLAEQYEAYKNRVEREEKKAFYARLVVVWVLFLVFWMVSHLPLIPWLFHRHFPASFPFILSRLGQPCSLTPKDGHLVMQCGSVSLMQRFRPCFTG
jgi:potassium channel subfamily K, other eukaryote